MNVLLTGCTAAHVSPHKNKRTRTFHGDIYRALVHKKNRVTWVEPSVFMSPEYISDFDSVIVGLAPPTSTAAHRIYGALSVINHAIEAENLTLVLDAPDPRRVWHGINSTIKNPETLSKSFYSKRKEYKATENPEVFQRMLETLEVLSTEKWPTTIFPAFPWMSFSSVSSYVPMTSEKNLVGLCFDEKHLTDSNKIYKSPAPNYWLSDGINSPWTKRQEKLLNLPVQGIKSSKWETDIESSKRFYDSIGCLVTTYVSGDPWWSPAVSQSLSLRTPVVSDWTLTSILGSSWKFLPHNFEEFTSEERYKIAQQQLDSYKNATPTWDSSVELLQESLR